MMHARAARRRSSVLALTLVVATTLAAADDGDRRSLSSRDALLIGRTAGGQLGFDVEPAGDVDGDGHTDVIAGAWYDSEHGTDAGAAYLVYGSARRDDVGASPTAKLTGERSGDAAGEAAAGVGDLDGDGYDDIAVGAPAMPRNVPSGNEGRAYLFYGRPDRIASGSLARADVTLVGEHASDLAGLDIARVGDLDGDGFEDLVVAAAGHGGSAAGTGKVYVFYGGPERLAGEVPLGSADAAFVGDHPSHTAGYAIAGGDLDSDGADDLVIGGQLAHLNGGAVHVVYGGERWSGTASLATAADLRLIGQPGDIAGTNLAASDLDSDGFADLLVGAPTIPPAGRAGAVHVYYGRTPRLTGTQLLSSSDATVIGETAGDQLGRGITAGDLDGDGHAELVLGAFGHDLAGTDAGAVYVISARHDRLEGAVAITGTAHLVVTGSAAGDRAGRSVAIVEDLDGDGCPELVVGAEGSDLGGDDAGALHLAFDGAGCHGGRRDLRSTGSSRWS